MQGILKPFGRGCKWRIFTISIGLINNSQRLCKYTQNAENHLLKKKMKDYFCNFNFFELSDTRKIMDFSSIPFEKLLSQFFSISNIEEKLYLFNKMNILCKFPIFYEKKLIYHLQKPEIPRISSLIQLKFPEKTQQNVMVYSPFGSKSLYYFKDPRFQQRKIFRIKTNSMNSSLILSSYEPFTQKADYCFISNSLDIQKLRNIMRLRNKIYQWRIFLSNISFQRGIIGTKLYFCRKDRENLKETQLKISEFQFSDILAFRQHPFLQNHYRNEVIYELFQIKSLGKCYIKIRIFFPLSEDIPKDFIKLKFEFFPLKKRCKVLKLVFSYGDILRIFGKRLSFHNVRGLLNELNKEIFPKVILHKENLQYILGLKHSDPEKVFLMNLSKGKLEKEAAFFLHIENLKYRTIFQIIKKIQGFFSVLTIKQHSYLPFWTIFFYFPQGLLAWIFAHYKKSFE